MQDLDQQLLELKRHALTRQHQVISHRNGNHLTIEGKTFLNFASNDYLGLSGNPAAIEAACKAMRDFGAGATASRLICGHTQLHNQTENALAAFKNKPAALLLPSGYMANLALFSTLPTPNDLIFMDRLAHASMLDGARMSGARLIRFRHNDTEHLNRLLSKHRHDGGTVYIASEAVFSMEGDIAPLPDLLELSKKYNAYLILDEAHSTGVMGQTGHGIEEHFGLGDPDLIIVGTCSKALGVQGGFIAGQRALIDLLIAKARPHIYTTGIAPALCAAITSNLQAITPDLVASYHQKLTLTAEQLNAIGISSEAATGIFPIHIGTSEDALKTAATLKDQKILCMAIREPTVPKGAARLRLTLNATHDNADIMYLMKSLKNLALPAKE